MAAQREWFEKDYYKVLGVVSTASDKEITRAYRKLAKENHPDTNPGSEERFKEISAAYDVSATPTSARSTTRSARTGRSAASAAARRRGGGTFRMEDMGDLGDLFGGLFGGGGGRTRTTQRGPQRGADMEAQLHLSFQDAVHGVTTSVNVPQEVRCSNCRGSGAAPGTSTHTCPRCGGSGSLNDNQGLFSLSTVCPDCMGRGTLFDTPCPVCHGTGTEHKVRSVKVRIPAGVEGGQRIRVKGRGAPGQGMAPPGDLYVVVHVARHEVFGRSGRDLTITVPVTFPEAALGTTITVPTLDGKVTLKVPAGHGVGQGAARARPRRAGRVRPQRQEAGRPPGQGRGGGAHGAHRRAEGGRGVAGRGDRAGAADRGGRMNAGEGREADERGDGVMADRDANQAVYVISVAAELTGMHPQTLRIYERKGLLDPSRTSGGSRRFSDHDLERLRHIQELTSTGLNLEGVRRVLQLETELTRLREELVQVRAQALDAVAATHRQYRRDLVPLRQSPGAVPAPDGDLGTA